MLKPVKELLLEAGLLETIDLPTSGGHRKGDIIQCLKGSLGMMPTYKTVKLVSTLGVKYGWTIWSVQTVTIACALCGYDGSTSEAIHNQTCGCYCHIRRESAHA